MFSQEHSAQGGQSRITQPQTDQAAQGWTALVCRGGGGDGGGRRRHTRKAG